MMLAKRELSHEIRDQPSLFRLRIVEGNVRDVDVVKVTRLGDESDAGDAIYSINIVGWGVPSTNLKVANSLRVMGKAQYDLAALTQIISREVHEARVTFDDGTVKEGSLLLVQGQVS